MINDTFYDIAIIGGGISSCVFSSFHLKNGYQGRIAIIENGRNLGGRSSTRNSISNSCLLYTSPSPRDKRQSRMPSSA